MTAHALHSLYGGKAARTGEAQEKREQTVFTPPWLIAELTRVAQAPLRLDVCTTDENPTAAQVYITEGIDGRAVAWGAALADGWFYMNPPYADLAAWLQKAAAEHRAGCRGYGLIPFRPHRTWFCDLLRGIPLVTLRPVKFVGHKSGFPAPLCIPCWGMPVPESLNGDKGRKSPSVDMITGVWVLS